MQKWEYCYLIIPFEDHNGQPVLVEDKALIIYYGKNKEDYRQVSALITDKPLVDNIRQLGLDGWEMCGAEDSKLVGGSIHSHYFKRPIIQP